MSEGETIAMNWATEMTALAAAGHGLWLDFDAFLDSPAEGLAATFAEVGEGTVGLVVDSRLNGPGLLERLSQAYSIQYFVSDTALPGLPAGALLVEGIVLMAAIGILGCE